MACAELERLREEVRTLRKELETKRRMARQKSHLDRGGAPPGMSDYEPFLLRRIARAITDLESHIEEHNCGG